MKYIAPLANTVGLEFEEVAASIGIMANAGIKGSQAGTTLRGALSRLATAVDDRTITVYWKCGLMTTVPTGIIADRENPRMLAKAWKESCERIAQRENQQIVAGV